MGFTQRGLVFNGESFGVTSMEGSDVALNGLIIFAEKNSTFLGLVWGTAGISISVFATAIGPWVRQS